MWFLGMKDKGGGISLRVADNISAVGMVGEVQGMVRILRANTLIASHVA